MPTRDINRNIKEQRKALFEAQWPLLPLKCSVTIKDVHQLRKQACEHLDLLKRNYKKARKCAHDGQLSAHYSQLGLFHTQLYEATNNIAANLLIQINAQACKNNAKLDLHYLRVVEALESLDIYIDAHLRKLKDKKFINENEHGVVRKTLHLITGRGKHSPAGPKIKPAVEKRLLERGLSYFEVNPGMLGTIVTADHLLTHEIKTE